jgi:hypothetical protein
MRTYYHVKHIVEDDKLGDFVFTIAVFDSKESAVAYCSGKDPFLTSIEAYQDDDLVREYTSSGDCLSHD